MNRPQVLAKAHDLKDLVAWQVGMELAVAIYEATKAFPADEHF